MYNIYNTISDIDIRNGETKRMNCPVCNGYKTFTVTNNMGSLIWNCYKASCDIKGGTRVHMSVDDIRAGFTGAEEYASSDFEMPSYIVPHRSKRELIMWCAKWGIDENKLNLMYDVKENRVVFPVVHNGVVVDATGRSLGSRIPKWKRYGISGLPYVHGCGSVAVVVEDCVSAAIVGSDDRFVGVAVLGTSLSESHKSYLSQFSTAVIALDPDAAPKTLAIAKELRGHVNSVRVLRLKDDIKYRHPDDMASLYNLNQQRSE
jgi:ribosomal protein L37AE/L43A